MKPACLLVVVLILLIGAPTSASSQNTQEKETKSEPAKKKKPPKGPTSKSREDPAPNTPSSAPYGPSSPAAESRVRPGGDQGNLIGPGSPDEPLKPVVPKDQKSPGLALGLSALLPGCGQYYNGEYLKGAVQTGIFATGIVLALTLGTASSYSSNAYTDYGYYGTYTYYNPTTEEWTTAWMYVGIGVAAGAWVWSVIDAPISANSHNEGSQGSTYGHMFESGNPAFVVGIDVAALRPGAGVNLTIHF